MRRVNHSYFNFSNVGSYDYTLLVGGEGKMASVRMHCWWEGRVRMSSPPSCAKTEKVRLLILHETLACMFSSTDYGSLFFIFSKTNCMQLFGWSIRLLFSCWTLDHLLILMYEKASFLCCCIQSLKLFRKHWSSTNIKQTDDEVDLLNWSN